MKPFYERLCPVTAVAGSISSSIADILETNNDEFMNVSVSNVSTLNSIAEKLPQSLHPEQRKIFKDMLHEFPEILSDKPGLTNIIVHDSDVKDAVPIMQHPYRLHPKNAVLVRDDIHKMELHGIIESS